MVVFAIRWHESATGVHMCPPILNPPPTSQKDGSAFFSERTWSCPLPSVAIPNLTSSLGHETVRFALGTLLKILQACGVPQESFNPRDRQNEGPHEWGLKRQPPLNIGHSETCPNLLSGLDCPDRTFPLISLVVLCEVKKEWPQFSRGRISGWRIRFQDWPGPWWGPWVKREVSLDPQMRRLYRPLPLFLTPEALGRIIRMRSLFISVWSQWGKGLFYQDQTSILRRVASWPSPSGKWGPSVLMRGSLPPRRKAHRVAPLLSGRDAQRRTLTPH